MKKLLIIFFCSTLLAIPKKEHLLLISRLTPWEIVAPTSGHCLVVSAVQRYLRSHDGLGRQWAQCCCADTLSELEQILRDIRMIYVDLSESDIEMLKRFGLNKDEIVDKLSYLERLKKLNLEKEIAKLEREKERVVESPRFRILEAYREFSISPGLNAEQQYRQSLSIVEPMVQYLLYARDKNTWISILRKNRILWRAIRRHVSELSIRDQVRDINLSYLKRKCDKDFYHWLDAKTEQLALSHPDEAGHLLGQLRG